MFGFGKPRVPTRVCFSKHLKHVYFKQHTRLSILCLRASARLNRHFLNAGPNTLAN